MKTFLRPFGLCAFLVACALSLSACGTTSAPDFRGDWRSANSAPESPQAIALRPQRMYSVAPVDGTLKSTVERWAGDAGVALRYDAAFDFTLHAAAGEVSDPDLASALRKLANTYAKQGIEITIEDAGIVVRVGDAPGSGPSDSRLGR